MIRKTKKKVGELMYTQVNSIKHCVTKETYKKLRSPLPNLLQVSLKKIRYTRINQIKSLIAAYVLALLWP